MSTDEPRHLGTNPGDLEYPEPEPYRAHQDCLCTVCGKKYIDHPFSHHTDWMGQKYLHKLCNGDLVKL